MMGERLDYLSDEELKKLIVEVEEQGLVCPPPDFLSQVMTRTKKKGKAVTIPSWKFSIQVAVAIAASIAILLIPSFWKGEMEEIPGKRVVLSRMEVRDKQDVLENGSGFKYLVKESMEFLGR